MKNRTHEKKIARLFRRAVRHSSPTAPAFRPPFLAQREIARLYRWMAFGKKNRSLGLVNTTETSVQETNPSSSERLITTPSSPTLPEPTAPSQPEPESPTESIGEASPSTVYSRPDLVKMTAKQLGQIAKNAGVKGWYSMRKEALVDSLADFSW